MVLRSKYKMDHRKELELSSSDTDEDQTQTVSKNDQNHENVRLIGMMNYLAV